LYNLATSKSAIWLFRFVVTIFVSKVGFLSRKRQRFQATNAYSTPTSTAFFVQY